MTANVSPPTGTVSELVAIITDPRWTVYPGKAPPGAGADTDGLYVVIWPGDPHRIGVGLASESWGNIRDQWILAAFGATLDESRQVRNALLEKDWPTGWELTEITPTLPRDVADPALWQSSIMVRDATG